MPKIRMLDVKNRKIIDPALELTRKDAVILELQEAAEFEARVAARLARMMLEPNRDKYPCKEGLADIECMRDKSNLTGPYAVHCEDCILREVRLQVEVEMDGKTSI